MLIEIKTSACKLKAIYLGEVDRFQLTRSTLANFKFQSLAKVKIDQVKKANIFFDYLKNSKARCWKNWRVPNVQLHMRNYIWRKLHYKG